MTIDHGLTKPMNLPSDLKPESVVAMVDTREQYPLDLSPLRIDRATLQTGDYSIRGLESVVRIERKSESDLLCCVGRERERFDREVERLLAFPVRILVVESSWKALEWGNWRSELKPSQVLGSVLGWQAAGLSVFMADTHERAGQLVSRLLFTIARREYRRLQSFGKSVAATGSEVPCAK